MMKGLVMDESISNLTSTSGEVTPQQSFASTNQEPASKKKRNLPGNPDPDAEVIALSPKSLMATTRFMCEICNKGFQRDQNLQLHRRGHNLPWKLKQTNKEVVRKKVYVCPETTCVHHHPSRALGDLTGIKKHFCRKHGEKKWKCEKCSKRYAVQSDWKAHSKICGTREYRCDCGTLFSRRDSFITHRAFCDALAEETARVITAANPVLVSSQQQAGSTVSHMANLQPQQPQVLLSYAESHNARVRVGPGFPSTSLLSSSSSPFLFGQHPHSLSQQNQNPSSNTLPPFQAPLASPHMSATALLQKAAQMGVTMSKPVSIMQRPYHHQAQAQAHHMSGSTAFDTSTASFGLGLSSREFTHGLAYLGNKGAGAVPAGGAAPTSLLHDMMSTSSSFEQCFNETRDTKRTGVNFQENFDHHAFSKTKETQLRKFDHEGKASSSSNIGGNDGLTRDFLGLKAFHHSDIPSLPGMNHRVNSFSTYGKVQQNSQTPWQG